MLGLHVTSRFPPLDEIAKSKRVLLKQEVTIGLGIAIGGRAVSVTVIMRGTGLPHLEADCLAPFFLGKCEVGQKSREAATQSFTPPANDLNIRGGKGDLPGSGWHLLFGRHGGVRQHPVSQQTPEKVHAYKDSRNGDADQKSDGGHEQIDAAH